MPLSTPDEIEESATESSESSSNGGEIPKVEVDWMDESVPITEAVRANDRALAQPDDFGLVSGEAFRETVEFLGDRVDELEEENDELQERVDDLEFTIEVLAAESGVMEGECPECGGRMETTGVVNKRVECDDCGRSIGV